MNLGRMAPCALLFALLSAPGTGLAEGLSIALTNDDGWDATGIQALKEVLRQQGHTVTLVAPSNQQSGSGAALNSGQVTIRKQSDREYAAAVSEDRGAEPVTCVMLAVDIASSLDGRKPDLVVSGINRGANIGMGALHSGTVGAVIGALNPGISGAIPGIAISTDEPHCDADCVSDHYRVVAEYLSGLIERLQTKPGFLESELGLLPDGVGLNVNYPPLSRDKVKGVRVARQSHVLGISGSPRVFNRHCSDCAALEIGETAASQSLLTDGSSPDADSDVAAFYDGYITIVPIEADYTARDFARYLEVLTTEP